MFCGVAFEIRYLILSYKTNLCRDASFKTDHSFVPYLPHLLMSYCHIVWSVQSLPARNKPILNIKTFYGQNRLNIP